MNHEPGNILKEFETALKSFILERFSLWYQSYSNNLIPLQSLINSYKIQLTKKNNIIEHWQFFEKKATEALAWLEKINYQQETQRLSDICSQFNEKIEQLLQPLPVELKSFIQEDIWKAHAGDKLHRKLKKHIYSRLHKGKKIAKRLIGLKKLKNHDTNNGTFQFERIIPLHHFIRYYLARPLFRFIIGQWQGQMHTISGQLMVLQLKMKEFNHKALFLDKLPTLLHEQEESEIFEVFYDLAEILRNIEETIQILTGWENQFTHKLNLTWKDIDQSFLSTWQLAGTSQLRNRLYSEKKLLNNRKKREKKVAKFQEAWDTHFTGIIEEWRKDFELAILQYQALLLMEKSDKRLTRHVDTNLLPSITHISETIRKTVTDFKSSDDETTFQKLLNATSNQLLKQIQQEKLPLLLDSLNQIRTETTEQEFTKTLQKNIEKLSEEYRFFTYKDTSNVPPKSKTEVVALKRIIKNQFLKNLRQQHNNYISILEQKIESILRTTTEIDQIIEFNFDTAVTYMRFKNGNPNGFLDAKKDLLHGLERASRLTENISGDTLNLKKNGIAHFDQTILSFENDIAHLTEEQLQNFKNVYADTTSDAQHSETGNISPEPAITNSNALTRNAAKSFDYSSAFDAQMVKLPYTYARLFSLQPLEDDRFYLERVRQSSQIEQAYYTWKKGSRILIALTGDRGSGRKTFLNYTIRTHLKIKNNVRIRLDHRVTKEKELAQILCACFKVEAVDDLAKLTSMLQKSESTFVAVFEELQSLFLGTIAGFDLLKQFIQFILNTQQMIFWIIISETQAFTYLKKVLDIAKFFQIIINMDNLPANELELLLLKRHRISGYDLYFELDSKSMNHKNYKKLNDETTKQSLLSNYFFEKLTTYAHGNIAIGLLYWLWSIRNFQEDKLVLSTSIPVDYGPIEHLTRDDLLLVNTILHHSALSGAESAQIFREDAHTATLKLQKLYQLGILLAENKIFSLQTFLLPALITALQKKKLAY